MSTDDESNVLSYAHSVCSAVYQTAHYPMRAKMVSLTNEYGSRATAPAAKRREIRARLPGDSWGP